MTVAPAATTPPRRVGFLDLHACRIHFEVTGTGSPIVFMHGLGGNHVSWWQQVAHFSATNTCITFAARGFAPSSPIAGGPDPKDFAGDLAAVLAHLKVERPVLIGQSMGGWGAVEYTLAHKGAVRALILAATTGAIDPRQIQEPERSRLTEWQANSERVAATLAAGGIHVAAGARMATEQPALQLLYRHIDEMNSSLDKLALRNRLFAARKRPPADLANAGCPILFISGDEDIVIPPFAADAIARVVPGAAVAHIPDAGHSAYFERPVRFNEVVEEFLRRF